MEWICLFCGVYYPNPGNIMGTGAMAGHCTEDNRSIFLACDYAGNVSVAEIQGGSHMVDEDMDLQASAHDSGRG